MKKSRLASVGICLFVLAGMIYMALNDTETENSKNQGQNEVYESGEHAVSNEGTDEIWEAEEDADPKKESTETDASSNQTEQAEEPGISETQEKEVSFDDPEDTGEYQWVYDYRSHFDEAWDGDDEWDLPYVDDETLPY